MQRAGDAPESVLWVVAVISALTWRTGVFVDKILMEKCGGQRKRQAVGVSAMTTTTFDGPRFNIVIRAKYVVSSAGSLHTPALLLRSKITCGGNVGKNLHIHPATAVTGVFGKVRCIALSFTLRLQSEPRVPAQLPSC